MPCIYNFSTLFSSSEKDFDVKGAMTLFLNKGVKTNKLGMINYINHSNQNKNAIEILKSTVYGPDNYLLRI